MVDQNNTAAALLYKDLQLSLRSFVSVKADEGTKINENERFTAEVTVFNSYFHQDILHLPRIVFKDVWVKLSNTDFAEVDLNPERGDEWYKLPGDKLFPQQKVRLNVKCTAIQQTTKKDLWGNLTHEDKMLVVASPWARLDAEEFFQVYGLNTSYSGSGDIFPKH
ncbi:hypothetical protein ABVF61_13010 [Roseibium sp. HPY-6]|uniref:hypothetical protein n=1 Tax=Roseibium sp. HPY-6 TaxID=3229852 RepID=UPI00338E5E3D